MKIQIKHRHTDAVLFEHEVSDERNASGLAVRDALEAAVALRTNLDGAYLDGANLDGANLDGAYLRSAYLRGANLGGANMRGANLGGAYMDGAYLDGANLGGANLGGAYLRGASLHGANLDGANMRGASLHGANLDGANMRGVRPVFQVGPIGSRGAYLTAYTTDQGVCLRTGCFSGTLGEFRAKLAEEHGDNIHGQEYAAALVLIEKHAELWPADPSQTL